MANVAFAKRAAQPRGLSIHDERRKKSLILTLERAKERAAETLLYMSAHDRDPEEMMNVRLAIEHIDIALGHLGVELE